MWHNFVVFQSLSHVWLFVTPWTAACQASLSFSVYQSLLRFMSTELVMLSKHLILCHHLLLLPSIFPSIRVFFNELAHCGQSIEVSASASDLPVNIQGWFPYDWLIWALCSPRNSQESSLALQLELQLEGISFLELSLLYGPTLTSVHDYWKNHRKLTSLFCLLL